jgi:molecular chaperone IbpA
MRTAYDFSPLYRSMIGVDHMADLIQSAMRGDGERNYPPYDVEKTADDAYRITIAVAGFQSDELDLVAQPNLLTVAGHKPDSGARTYLHQGIGGRDFQLRFELADYVVVKSATHADGLLTIDLVREVPEALKPRRIEIAGATGGEGARQITGKNKAT